MAAGKKGGLGRGLDALFADAVPVYDEAGAVKAQSIRQARRAKTTVCVISKFTISCRI